MGGPGSGRYPKGSGGQKDISKAGIGKHGGDDSTGTYKGKEDVLLDKVIKGELSNKEAKTQAWKEGVLDKYKEKKLNFEIEKNRKEIETENKKKIRNKRKKEKFKDYCGNRRN